MKAYLAKNKQGGVHAFLFDKPKKKRYIGVWDSHGMVFFVEVDALPFGVNPQWEDEEPILVEVNDRSIKKGVFVKGDIKCIDMEDKCMPIVTHINDICYQQHKNILSKGFCDKQHIGVYLMLIVSELSEALEADRKSNHANLNMFRDAILSGIPFKEAFEKHIKDTLEDEIADAFLRLMDLVGMYGIDIDKHINLKSNYNFLRPDKHGKQY